MAITLNEITLSVIPFAKLEFDTTQLSSTDEQPFKALLIGESENDFPSGDNPIKVLDQREAEEFGVDSALSEMAIYWLKNVPTIPLYVLPLKKGANALDLKARLQPLQTQSQYNIVVSAYSDQAYLVEIANHLETVGKGDYGKDGLAFASKSGTIRTLSDFIEGKGALGPSPDSPPSEGDDLPSTEPVSPRNPPNRGRNSENSGLVNEENQRLIPINHKNLTILASPEVTIPAIINSQGVVTTPAKKMSDHMRAVVYAGAVAVEAQKDPSRPFHALILKDMLSPLEKDEFSDRDLEALVKMGYSVYQVTYNRDCQLARTVTTYTKNSMGIDDYSFSDINIPLTMSRLRYSFISHFMNKFVLTRYKLASDDSLPPPGALVIQPKTARAEAFSLFDQWQEKQFIEDPDALRKSLLVEKKGNYLLFSFKPNLIEILLGVAGKAVMVR